MCWFNLANHFSINTSVLFECCDYLGTARKAKALVLFLTHRFHNARGLWTYFEHFKLDTVFKPLLKDSQRSTVTASLSIIKGLADDFSLDRWSYMFLYRFLFCSIRKRSNVSAINNKTRQTQGSICRLVPLTDRNYLLLENSLIIKLLNRVFWN